ncbi:MAG: hypothetical protein LKE33_10680 [Acidaminococcus sp.]|jgi:hypothetical protein|nr:hypothetical protein [Acidaminococcus sp.]
MKKLTVFSIIVGLFFCLAATCFASSVISDDGYFNNIKMCGKVRVVEYNPDVKVQVVTAFPDLNVKVVEHFPEEIGEWQFVEYGEDFTIQFVTHFPDIRIRYVNAFPGVA